MKKFFSAIHHFISDYILTFTLKKQIFHRIKVQRNNRDAIEELLQIAQEYPGRMSPELVAELQDLVVQAQQFENRATQLLTKIDDTKAIHLIHGSHSDNELDALVSMSNLYIDADNALCDRLRIAVEHVQSIL